MPVSFTAMVTPAGPSDTVTSTRPPSRLYFTALDTRLLSMISISPRSACNTTGAGRVQLHRDASLLRRGQRGLDRRARHLDQIDRGKFARLLPRLDAGQVEQIDNQLPHAVEAHQAAVDRALRGLRIRGRAFLQEAQVAFHGHERRLELVHQHGQELEANLALLLRQLACLPAQDVVPGRLANRVAQFFRGERLGQKIESPPLGGADRDIQRSVRR